MTDDRVWLNRPMKLRKQGTGEQKQLPQGTCLFLANIQHGCKHLVYVYGAGCFDSVPIDALEYEPSTTTQPSL